MSLEDKRPLASLPANTKPSACLGNGDRTRYAEIQDHNGSQRLVVTDAYKIAVLALSGDLVVTGLVPALALRQIEHRGLLFQASNEFIEPFTRTGDSIGCLHRRLRMGKSYVIEELEKPIEDPLQVGINAQFLSDLAAAFGTQTLRLTLDKAAEAPYTRHVHVSPIENNGCRGVLMPIRLPG